MLKNGLALFAAAMLGIAAPATAATFGMTGDTALDGPYGLSKTFTAGGIHLRASAWHAVADPGGYTYTITTGYLGDYSHGLGVTAANDSNGNNNLHTIDNKQGIDFVLLQFDRMVHLTKADLTPFQIGSSTDNDAWLSTGMTALPWTSKIDLDTNNALAMALINNGVSIKSGAGTPVTRSFASYGQSGNVWIIGADFKNLDGFDGFKLMNLVALAAVPEPSTWALLLGGFGLTGLAIRRRARGKVLTA